MSRSYQNLPTANTQRYRLRQAIGQPGREGTRYDWRFRLGSGCDRGRADNTPDPLHHRI